MKLPVPVPAYAALTDDYAPPWNGQSPNGQAPGTPTAEEDEPTDGRA